MASYRNKSIRKTILWMLLASVLISCSGDGTNEKTVSGPTYHSNIRPLLAQYCTSCHQDGGIAPFVLTDYANAKIWAEPSVAAVTHRTMPPYLADASGSCGDFKDAWWLSTEEIDLFRDWAASGAPKGDESISPPPQRELPSLSGTTKVITTGVDYLPTQDSPDDYRCFVVDSPGTFAVTGFDVRPSNPRIAHHLIAYQVTSESAAQRAYQLDEEAEGPGYPCFGTGPQVEAFTIAGWAPGAGATVYPEGTGVEITEGLPIIMEMHYNTLGGPGEKDQTELVLQVEESESVERLYEIIAIDYDFSGPPGLESWSTTDDFPISWSLYDYGLYEYRGDILIHGVNGHMHERGLSMLMESIGRGDECLLDIPQWDFNWQLYYWFDEPIRVPASDTMRITCDFTTLGLSEPLVWGDGTQDEMCLGSAYITLAD